MLTGNFDELRATDTLLHTIVQGFASGHVSRFPMTFSINQRANAPSIDFYDSRFGKPIASLYTETDVFGRFSKFVVNSPHITNNKFADNNSGYRTRATAKADVMIGLLKEYVRLVAPNDIHTLTVQTANSLHRNWQREFLDLVNTFALEGYGFGNEALRKAFTKDFMEHIFMDKPAYSHPELAKFKTKEFIDAYQEHHRRADIDAPRKNVHINPDGTVVRFTGAVAHAHNSLNEIGEELLSRLALLKMVEDSTVIGEVGIKINSTNFWLY